MKNWQRLLLGVGGATFVAGIGWRITSRRHLLPCPHWLSRLLENPYTDMVAGSDVLLDRLDLEPGMRVLDAGAGFGRLSLPAAARVGPEGTVVAVDVQEEMLRRLRERAEAAGVQNVQIVHAAIGAGRLPPDTFDRALLVTVLGEIPDRQGALAELYAALKPGGILSITEVLPDPHFQRQGTVRRLARATGFVEEKRFGGRLAYTLNVVKPEE